MFQENKVRQIFRKSSISYPLIRTRLLWYLLKTLENLRFSNVFRGCKMGTMARTELMKQLLSSLYLRYMKSKNKFLKFCISKVDLTILTWKNSHLIEFSTKIHWNIRLAAFDDFHMLHNQLSSFNSIIVQMSAKGDLSNVQ